MLKASALPTVPQFGSLWWWWWWWWWSSGGRVVSILAINSYEHILNPGEVYNFSIKLLPKRTKINKKSPGLAHSLETELQPH